MTALFLAAVGESELSRALLLGFAGYLLSALLTQVWVLLTAPLQSKKIRFVSLGNGRILAEATIGKALVQLRAVPGPLHVCWYAAQAPLARLRLWAGSALSVGLQGVIGVWLLSGTTTWPMGAAFLAATVVRIASTLRGPLGTGRILFVLPFSRSPLPLSTAANLRAGTAVNLGRLDELSSAVPELTPEDRPELDRGLLALADGRYAEAEQWGRTAFERAFSYDSALSAGLLLSSAIVGAADAGELPRERCLSRLMAVLGQFHGPAAAVARAVPAAADCARLDNRLDEALAAARTQRGQHTAPVWRAEAGCSRAAAPDGRAPV
ncbi:hypothetical protein, partial [Kitasatospora sp. NPDC047058]|uniref:hypothetical protein n=1 Tax=Kitasatospora sp. NPDC047058 TaxID=3155620 RepID=UPI0033C95236